MAVTLKPFVLNDVSLKLALITGGTAGVATEYMCQLNRAELVPSAQSSGSEMETFCETFDAPPKKASWVLELAGFAQHAAMEDLANFLFDHELEDAEFTLIPIEGSAAVSTTNPGFKGTVILSPTAIGGTANNYAALTVSLVVKGKPTRITTGTLAAEGASAEQPVEVAA